MTSDPDVRRVVDEHPAGAAFLDPDQVRAGQAAQPLSEGGPADAELARELVLGSDPVSRAKPL